MENLGNLGNLGKEEGEALSAIGHSLRAIRRQRGMTLRDVDRASHGRWKAVVVGSYERGDRALTLKRAIGLATFYEVPLDQLLGLEAGGARGSQPSTDSRVIFNLVAIRSLAPDLPPTFIRYLQELCRERSDWNGEVLTIRSSDTTALAIIADIRREELAQWAIDRGILISAN